MSNDLPDFLGGEPVSAAAPVAEAPAVIETPVVEAAPAAEAPVAEAPARGPDGKFLPKVEAAPVAATPPAEAAPPASEPNHAPLAALLDERDKRQAAERERDAATARARELETWRQQQEAAATRKPTPQAPDPEKDPAGFQRWQVDQQINARLDAALYDQTLGISRRFATTQHGEETVKSAFDWGVQRCDTDPHFNAKVRSSADPVGFVVDEWKREQTLSQFADVDPAKFEAFRAWEAAQAASPAPVQQAQQATQVATLPQAPVAPRPSLAAAPSAATTASALVRDGPAAFDAMFSR